MSVEERPRFQTIKMVLRALCDQLGFDAAVLVGEEGLPLATADSPYDSEALAAVTSFFRRSARQVQTQLGWEGLDQVSVTANDGRQLVGRTFEVEGEEIILVVLLPGQMPYRQLTNRAVEAISWAWTHMGGSGNVHKPNTT
jgi:predicted regulator of Ras-like GTPase activity (Roadblock/LC7/MglB family)